MTSLFTAIILSSWMSLTLGIPQGDPSFPPGPPPSTGDIEDKFEMAVSFPWIQVNKWLLTPIVFVGRQTLCLLTDKDIDSCY